MLGNLIVIVIIGFVFYKMVSWAEKQPQKKHKPIRTENFLKSKERLEQTGDYALIRNFVLKYGYVESEGTLYSASELESRLQYPEHVSKLDDLLESKGYTLDENEIKQLLYEAFLELKYDTFHETMLANSPGSIDACVKNLVDLYGDDYALYLDDLWKLLGEGEFTYDEEEVRNRIGKAIKNLKLKRFEDKLKSNDPSYSINDVDSMTGFEFEGFLKKLFENMGYKVTHTQLSGDRGLTLLWTSTMKRP